ncbi:MAG: hypothetical protein Q8O57_09040, partial [Kiritimatiellota bacterium]|nr:hypothetical protein [Kiritimatiellota bacterium]
EAFSRKFGIKNPKLIVNHISFNPTGDRFVFLARNMPMPGSNDDRLTLVATADISGGNLHVMHGFGRYSHYIWRDPKHILAYADLPGAGKMALCLARDQSHEFEVLQPDFFAFDGHCSYSLDKEFILYDSYPDADGYRQLLLYDIRRKKGVLLANLFSGKNQYLPNGDARCDLHPRWNRDGTAISFDSMHEGHRHVYWMELAGIKGG